MLFMFKSAIDSWKSVELMRQKMHVAFGKAVCQVITLLRCLILLFVTSHRSTLTTKPGSSSDWMFRHQQRIASMKPRRSSLALWKKTHTPGSSVLTSTETFCNLIIIKMWRDLDNTGVSTLKTTAQELYKDNGKWMALTLGLDLWTDMDLQNFGDFGHWISLIYLYSSCHLALLLHYMSLELPSSWISWYFL